MAATALTERYAANLHGVLSCFDRIIITGTLPGACYAGGMTSFLYAHGIRIFDYPRFAEPCGIRSGSMRRKCAAEQGIDHRARPQARTSARKTWWPGAAARGDAPGLVHVLSAMESLSELQALARQEHRQDDSCAPDTGKCLHYYFYFIDEELGLCYLRVPTWAPFGLQFYCNGHSALARALKREGIEYAQADNAFLRIAESNGRRRWPTHSARTYCTDGWIATRSGCARCLTCSGRTLALEHPPGRILHRPDVSQPSTSWCRCMTQSPARPCSRPKRDQVAGFLGKKITPQLAQEIGSRLSTRIEGRCIKHYIGAAGVKMYDKFSRVLRVETTVNDVSFFKHHRKVEHKDAARHARAGAAEEDDLQPDRSARDSAGLQPALPGVPVQPGRPQRGRA